MLSTFLLKQVNSFFFFLADEIPVILCDFLNKVFFNYNNNNNNNNNNNKAANTVK